MKRHEDVLHEPEFPGDEAIIGQAFWEVWGDVEERPGGFVGVWIDYFDREEQAQAPADKSNAEDVAA